MATIELKGHITANRQLEVEIPDDLPVGEVRVLIEIPPYDEQHKEEFRQAVQNIMQKHRWLIDELARQ